MKENGLMGRSMVTLDIFLFLIYGHPIVNFSFKPLPCVQTEDVLQYNSKNKKI